MERALAADPVREELLLAELARTTDDGLRYAIEHPLVARTTWYGMDHAAQVALYRDVLASVERR